MKVINKSFPNFWMVQRLVHDVINLLYYMITLLKLPYYSKIIIFLKSQQGMIIATCWLLESGGVVVLNQINIFDPMVNNTDTIKNFQFFSYSSNFSEKMDKISQNMAFQICCYLILNQHKIFDLTTYNINRFQIIQLSTKWVYQGSSSIGKKGEYLGIGYMFL